MKPMKVLVACEESGVVRDAFRRRGHEAFSNDLEGIEPGGEFPNYHLYGDSRWFIGPDWKWDLVIAFPPCTYLTVSAAWAFKDPDFKRYPKCGYHQNVKPGTLTGAKRRKARDEAAKFVRALYASADRVAIENPIGNLSKLFREPDQIIHPWQFGHDASKATCLWLKNLPKLLPTKMIAPRIVNGLKRWSNQTDNGQNKLSPSPDRAMLRSKTYEGIAEAMADAWTK